MNSQTVTVPASISTKESAPKPIRAIDPAAIPAPIAIANSMTCRAFPLQASSRARRSSLIRSSDEAAALSDIILTL